MNKPEYITNLTRAIITRMKRVIGPKSTSDQTSVADKPVYTNSQNFSSLRNVLDLDSTLCCGCGACVNVCSIEALYMSRDSEGYLIPQATTKKCVQCGKCTRSCPVVHPVKKNRAAPECYAVMADNDIRQKSSSGGAFTLLAEYILNQGGLVCGAAFDDQFQVNHILIDSPNDLEKLRGSKYVQSSTGHTFTEIKRFLDLGKRILFSGTPCQVAGLTNYLGKDYSNLLTVDIVCHGTPSQKVFDRYIEDNYGRDNLTEFRFRTKRYGYNCVNQIAKLKNGCELGSNIAFDSYEKCMHTGLAAKAVCGECPFAETPRQGDITIGDFWGISEFNPEYNDNLGTSVLLVNNQRGEHIWNQIRENCLLAVSVPFDIARRHNRFGSHINIPKGRNWFFHSLDNKDFNTAVDYSLNRKFDVGVIGLWFGLNYGSMATYYALHHTLKSMGLSVLMIENSLRPDSEDIYAKTHPFRIAKEFYDISKRYPLHELHILNRHCDTFLVGSDQLWNPGLSRPYRQTYFLDFVEDNKKKISVSTSFGREYWGTEEEKLISTHNLKRFDYISVRDSLSASICSQWGLDATETCDPALFCTSTDYEPLVQMANIDCPGDYILAYILDPDAKMGQLLHKIGKERGLPVTLILDLPAANWEKHKQDLDAEEYDNIHIVQDVDLTEWLWYYKNASSVVTDSYHGTIFSLLYEKPFIALKNSVRGAERFVSLLTPLHLLERLKNSVEEIDENRELLESMDYASVNEGLDKMRDHSLTWLKDALYAPKKIRSKSIYTVIDLAEETKEKAYS